MRPSTSMLALNALSSLALCLIPLAIAAADTPWFTVSIPEGWKTVEVDDAVHVEDASGTTRFSVSVNKKNNDFIGCFCAPWKDYEKFDNNGFRAARIKVLGVLTVKVSGTKNSTSVHYTLRNDDQDQINVTAIESIRPR